MSRPSLAELEEELSERVSHVLVEAAESIDEANDLTNTKRRGRQPLPLAWSKVITIWSAWAARTARGRHGSFLAPRRVSLRLVPLVWAERKLTVAMSRSKRAPRFVKIMSSQVNVEFHSAE